MLRPAIAASRSLPGGRLAAAAVLMVCMLSCHARDRAASPAPRPATHARAARHAERGVRAPRPGHRLPRYRVARRAEHAALVAHERALAREPVAYARKHRADRFRPAGLYLDPRTRILWAWSHAHPVQRGFVERDGRWQPAGTRTGPLDTRRCIALHEQPLTLCLGLLEAQGFRAFGGARFASGLPARGGFRDFAVSEGHGRVYVIDAYLDALWVLSTGGAVIARVPLLPSAYAIGMLGSEHLFVLSANQPHLSVLSLDDGGLPSAAVGMETAATIRGAAFDHARQLLWTAGYRQARVRRNRGYVENLESFVYAYRKGDLLRGAFVPALAVDLAQEQLADPVALALGASHVYAAISGSHRLARLDLGDRVPGAAAVQVDAEDSAFVPSAVLATGDQVLVAGRLGDRIHVHRATDLARVQVLALDHGAAAPAAPPTPYEIGEVIFYSKALWAEMPRNQFTCNSCHWDGLTDYRVHPGFKESRWEQIRPAAGAGMLAPIFSPGQARNLSTAVHGFVRALDERFWTPPAEPACLPPWLDDVDIEIAPDQRQILSPYDLRLALLTYLARRPVEPGFLRAPGQPLSASARRGAAIFWRDCAGCHQPTPHLASGRILDREAALDYLIDRPLAFGAGRLARTGARPYFTEQGNRISPLTQLARGGPFFTNGSARTLQAAILRTDPTKPEVHAPENAEAPFYGAGDVQLLRDFLLSI